MRVVLAAVAFTMLTTCGDVADQHSGQWRDGPWQQPTIKGCSAEVVVRAPTKLLGFLNEWPLEATINRCPMGVLTVEGELVDFLPWVSPATARELRALLVLGEKRAAEAARLVDPEHRAGVAANECRDLMIRIEANHMREGTGQLVARNMLPPEAGARYEFEGQPVERHGLLGLGRMLQRDVRIDPATERQEEFRFPLTISAWLLPEPNPQGLSFNCRHPIYPHLGACNARKDRSRAVQIEYSMCMPLLPDWRAVDRAVGMVADDWIAGERLVKYAKK